MTSATSSPVGRVNPAANAMAPASHHEPRSENSTANTASAVYSASA
jgi:hypothetical protein